MLGIGEDEIVLLGFGALRPYKGFDRLVPVADHLEARLGRPVRILLAGPVFRSWGVSDLEDLADLDPRVLLLRGSVPDEHVQVLFRAADLAVLPYRHMLNSSVLMLSLTFGLRAVSPDVPPARDVLDSGLVHLFPMEDDAALAETVEKAIGLGRGGPLAPELARRFDAARAARAFARQVAERVLGREPSADAAAELSRPAS
jgi:glycosyltransferase involved in cell wall biosynthesis